MKMFDFIKKYRRDFALIIIVGVIFYWFSAIFSPKLDGINTFKNKIDSIDNKIVLLREQQKQVDENISELKGEVFEVESTIGSVKNQKVIIKEYYENKINSVDKFTNDELDSFFSSRYGRQYTN
jgi:prophage DNA circulation protein